MPKILILAPSGFGKTSGIGPNPDINIEGLPVEKTYLITVTSKDLPFAGSRKLYPATDSTNIEDLKKSKRFISNNAKDIAAVLNALATNPNIENVVIDDTNYIMQDYYMDNALKQGWDAPKKVGYDMGQIFKALEKFHDKNVFVLAHYQLNKLSADESRVEYQMKTTGKMTDEYLTPSGKFDITLVGKTRMDPSSKKVEKYYVTNDDGETQGAKSAPGMFPINITNDLGYIAKRVKQFYEGE